MKYLMKKIMTTSLLIVASVALVNCSTRIGGVNLGGYIYDSKTGAKITTYTMEVETANAIMSDTTGEVTIATAEAGATESEVGKFTVNIPVNEQFVVRVTAEGYNSFVSSTIAGLTDTNTNTGNQPSSALTNIMLTPTGTFATAGAINVIDSSAAAVKAPTLVNTGVAVAASAITRGFQTNGGNIAEDTKAFWLADIVGTDAGVIAIPADSLRKGYQYTFKIVADSYTSSANITIDTDNLGAQNEIFATGGMTVVLSKHATNSGLNLLAASNEILVDGVLKPISGILTVTYTFDQAVEIDTTGLYGAGLTAAALYGGTFFTSDTKALGGDFDGATTGLDLTKEVAPVSATTTVAATKSNLLDVTVSGSSITVTISPSFTTQDTGDVIYFDITGITNLVKVRAASDNNITSGSTVLSTLTTAQQERLYYQAGTLTGF